MVLKICYLAHCQRRLESRRYIEYLLCTLYVLTAKLREITWCREPNSTAFLNYLISEDDIGQS